MRQRKIFTICILSFLIVSNLPLFGLSVEGIKFKHSEFQEKRVKISLIKYSYEIHDPIKIDNNDDFTSENGVVSGTGEANDPFIIENWEINGRGYAYCIYIENTTAYFEIRHCYLHNSTINGLILFNVSNGNIIENYISDHREDGVVFTKSYKNSLYKNIITKNGFDGIYLLSSNYNCLKNNTFSKNVYDGICIKDSSYNKLINNTITENDVGIHMKNSYYNNISHNNISINRGISSYDYRPSGLWILNSNDNIIYNNSCGYNLYGVYLQNSSDNSVYMNYFYNNEINAVDDGNNIWSRNNTDKTLGIMGNYWDDYKGHDRDGDGFGDELLPYNCYGKIENGGDWHPITKKNIAPIASFSYEIKEDGFVSFTDESNDPDGYINAWYWDFGDGGKSRERNPIHRFKKKGTYHVTLTVEDNNACRSSITMEIDIPKNKDKCRSSITMKIDLSEIIELYKGDIKWLKECHLDAHLIGICN